MPIIYGDTTISGSIIIAGAAELVGTTTIGSLTVLNDICINGDTYLMSQYVTETLSVSGHSELYDVSADTLTVSGQSWLTDISVSGQAYLSDVSADTLTVSGQSWLTDVSANHLTASQAWLTDVSVSGTLSGGLVNEGSYRLLPPGVILPYSISSAPLGFLLCDGSAYDRTVYSGLFSVIGTIYGAPSPSTFRVPDMRQRIPYYGTTIGEAGGRSSVTLSLEHIPAHTHTGITSSDGSHNHTVNDPGHTHISRIAVDDNNGSTVEGQAPPGDSFVNVVNGMSTSSSTTGISLSASDTHTHTFTTSSVGSGTSFSVLNPYLSLSFIIKY